MRCGAGNWDVPVIFDRGGYDSKTPPVDTEQWFDEQADARCRPASYRRRPGSPGDTSGEP